MRFLIKLIEVPVFQFLYQSDKEIGTRFSRMRPYISAAA